MVLQLSFSDFQRATKLLVAYFQITSSILVLVLQAVNRCRDSASTVNEFST